MPDLELRQVHKFFYVRVPTINNARKTQRKMLNYNIIALLKIKPYFLSNFKDFEKRKAN